MKGGEKMQDVVAMNVNVQPKVQKAEPQKASLKSKPEAKEQPKEFKDLVNEYSKNEKAEGKTTSKTEKTESKAEVLKEEEPTKPNEQAQQMAVELLMQMFSFTQEEANVVLDEIMSTGNSQQLMQVLTLAGQDKQAQASELMSMLGIEQNSNADPNEAVTDFVSQFTQIVNKENKITNGNNIQAKILVKGEQKQNIQHSPQVVVEKQAKNSEDQLTVQANFKSAVKQAKTLLDQTKQEQKTSNVDVDKLQEQAQNVKFAGGMRYVDSTQQMGMSEKELQNSIASQVKTGIVENLNNLKGVSKNEFVIKLRPEGLGEITVTMAQTGKDIMLNIITQKSETQRLLNAEIMQLKEALKPYNAQIEQVSAKTDVSYGSFSNGSEQFFGRNGSWQSGSNQRQYHGNSQPDAEEVEQEEIYREVRNELLYA